jgi:hypothetical protein
MKLFGRKEKAVPVVAKEGRWGVEYRRPDDGENVIRINQRNPKGFNERLYEFVPVAGVSYREKDVVAFIEGADRELSLRREFVDEAHPDALAVWGLWKDGDRSQAARLGFVPREVNDAIGARPVAATLAAMYRPLKDKGPGLRMDIWGARIRK